MRELLHLVQVVHEARRIVLSKKDFAILRRNVNHLIAPDVCAPVANPANPIASNPRSGKREWG